jgi:hypothetical protein
MILLKFLEKNIINYSALLEELNLLYTTQVRWDIRPRLGRTIETLRSKAFNSLAEVN